MIWESHQIKTLKSVQYWVYRLAFCWLDLIWSTAFWISVIVHLSIHNMHRLLEDLERMTYKVYLLEMENIVGVL